MDEAEIAEFTAVNARCDASPRAAAHFAATLRTITHAEKESMLFNSTFLNYSTLVRLLLADGFSPNTVDPAQGNTSLLRVAAQRGSIDVVRLLLEAGANANSTDIV